VSTFASKLYSLCQQTKQSKLAAKDFVTAKFHRDTWNCSLRLGLLSAHIPWNAIYNLELGRSYDALRSKLVPQSASTLSNLRWREYSLTKDAIKKQLL